MNIKLVCKRKYTELDNIFIDEYMADAMPVYALVYIYALRMASENKDVSNAEIAEKLKILESDVVKAWQYWKKVGAVKITGGKTNPSIEFCDIKPVKNKEKKQDNTQADVNVVPIGTKPVYNPQDIRVLCGNDKKVDDLLKIAQTTMGHPLSPNDISTIVGFYDWLKLPVDVVAVLLTYASQNSKPMRYIEKMAVDWSEKEIKTAEEAEKQLNYYSGEYKEILGYFGVHNRLASADEQKYMLKWLKEYNMPMQNIRLACEKTISNTGQVSFPYASKIIENWHKKGIQTIEDIENESKAHKQEVNAGSKMVVKKNTFNGYEQPSYDDDEFERIVKRKIQ